MLVYVYYGTKDFEFVLGNESQTENPERIYEINKSLEDVALGIKSWVEMRHGKHYLDARTSGVFSVEAEYAVELPHLYNFVMSASKDMHWNFGVGVNMVDAQTASEWGQENAETIALYNDDMVEDEEGSSDLFKGEALEHPEPHGQVALDQPDLTSVINEAIQKLKSNAKAIETLRESQPEVYATIRHISQAMVALARQVSEVKQAAKEESLEKAQSPVLKPKKVKRKFPKPLEAVADNSGPIFHGRIKSASIDQQTGETKKIGWHSTRSGMIVGRSGQIVSSREPNAD